MAQQGGDSSTGADGSGVVVDPNAMPQPTPPTPADPNVTGPDKKKEAQKDRKGGKPSFKSVATMLSKGK